MKKIILTKPSIRLGQFLKLADIISSGGLAKTYLLDHVVFINERQANGRGATIVIGDIIKIDGEEYETCGSEALS